MTQFTPATGPGHLSYVYAVGRAGPELEAAAARLSGLSGAPVRTVGSGELSAVACSVPAADFDEAGLKAQLEDLSKLEEIARSHHAVVEALAGHMTVLPLRLATVYLDDERVAWMLEESRDEFGALLGRLEGHVEWGVKVYADPDSGPPPAPEPSPPDAPASPGRAYLQRRRAQQSTQRNAYRAAGEAAARISAVAASLATDRMAHRPQQGELAHGAGENVANEAYLVPLPDTDEFRAAVEEACRDLPGVRVEVTGPWAPYSFATPTQPAGAGRGSHEQ
ncbi:GvpL/GvpF family gas vesicle protein [Streptomyces sp. NPDC004647]|uniref:GvpL/GvpF family gas vesicle protein n=1 Tax=Streptomyces sp. NPDC004647 TaxID=3154671 RepID=UPI0033AB2B39